MKLEVLRQLSEALKKPLPEGFSWDWSTFSNPKCGCALSLGMFTGIIPVEGIVPANNYAASRKNLYRLADYLDMRTWDFDELFMRAGGENVLNLLDERLGPLLIAELIDNFIQKVENETRSLETTS